MVQQKREEEAEEDISEENNQQELILLFNSENRSFSLDENQHNFSHQTLISCNQFPNQEEIPFEIDKYKNLNFIDFNNKDNGFSYFENF